MKKLLFLLLLIANYGYNQTIISGKVYDSNTNKPLNDARVFISNTTTSVITSSDGTFAISVPKSNYQIIVFHTEYQAVVIRSENLTDTSKRYIINLLPITETSKTLKINHDDDREKYLKIFIDNLIGTSENARKTKIKNLNDVILTINDTTGNLEAHSENPLIIENSALKYRLTFLLSEFRYNFTNQLSFSTGYPAFEDLNADGNKKAKIDKNRRKAYNGSVMHFVRSLYNNTFEEEGYIINSFSRNLNPKYPGDEIIKKLNEEAQKTNDYSKLGHRPPQKYNIVFKKSKLTQNDLIIIDVDNNKYLLFTDYLEIKYSKDSEEINYLIQLPHKLNEHTQTSQLTIESEKVLIYSNGNISNPDQTVFYGYMGWKKLADALPLDYSPK